MKLELSHCNLSGTLRYLVFPYKLILINTFVCFLNIFCRKRRRKCCVGKILLTLSRTSNNRKKIAKPSQQCADYLIIIALW